MSVRRSKRSAATAAENKIQAVIDDIDRYEHQIKLNLTLEVIANFQMRLSLLNVWSLASNLAETSAVN